VSRWFRFYDDALNNPKVQRLSGDMFKAWVNLMCLTSKNGGEIKSLADAAFALRTTEAKAAVIVTALTTAGLLDPVEARYFAPHDWKSRQFKSDVSNDRVQQHRERKRNAECNVTGNGDETPSEQNRTEQIQKGQVGNFLKVGEVKARGPKHGAVSPSRGTVFVRKGTTDWEAYADDYRKSFGVEPEPNADGGYWFKIAGTTPIPPPARIARHEH